MVTLIPELPDFNESTAEEVVWNALRRQLPDGVTIIHGQRLTGDDKDVEIDLLVLWPGAGIAVIVVKGGRADVIDGKWFTSGTQGKRNHLPQPPLEQAMIAKHTVVDYLRPRLSRLPGPISHLAVLPYTELPSSWDQPDAPRRQLVDGTEIESLASKISTQLRFDFDPERHDLTAGHEFVLKNLRRTNQAAENFALKASEISHRADALSCEQSKLIRILRHQIRAEISGGAGSGKTYLALLKARALTQEGKRVALMCCSRGLGRWHALRLHRRTSADLRPPGRITHHDESHPAR